MRCRRSAWRLCRRSQSVRSRRAPSALPSRAADRVALDSEIGVMKAAVRRQDSRVLLDVGGSFFPTSRATLTSVPGSIPEAIFSGRHTITADEDGWLSIDRDG